MIKYLFFYILLWCISLSLFSQTALTPPAVIPASPKAENFFRFNSYLLNPSTGAPDISVPLYTIKCGKLEVPITLRYHIANIKPGADQSDVGFGWILDVGGQISRSICGQPDDACPRPSVDKYSDQIDQSVFSDFLYLRDVVQQASDTEYDIFNYSFLSQNGQFIKTQSGADVFPYKPLKFNFITGLDPMVKRNLLATIKITDARGDLYTFGDGATGYISAPSNLFAYTTWMLSKIQDINNVDVINFSYVKPNEYSITEDNIYDHYTISNRYCSVFLAYSGCSYPSIHTMGYCSAPGYMSTVSYQDLTPKEIDFNGGKVVFDVSDDNKLIKGFTVYSLQEGNFVTIKTISFDRSSFGSWNHHRLDKVHIYDNTKFKSEDYQFVYNTDIMPNSFGLMGTDYWGFCNNSSEGCAKRDIIYQYTQNYIPPAEWPTTCPDIFHSENYQGSSNKSPSVYAAQFEMLQKIILPTKGETEFVYEGNTYTQMLGQECSVCQQIESPAGGVRVHQIIERDGIGGVSTKTYKYENGGIQHGYENSTYFKDESYFIIGGAGPLNNYLYSNTTIYNSDFGCFGDNNVKYGKVTEFIGNTDYDNNNNLGKTVYYYQFDNLNVTSLYQPGIGDDSRSSSSMYEKTIVSNKRDWDNGLLYKKEIYKRNSDNTYYMISKENNSYEHIIDPNNKYHNLKVFNLVSFPGSDYLNQWTNRSAMRSSIGDVVPAKYTIFGSYDYYITTGRTHLNQKQNVQYFRNGSLLDSIVSTTNYFYDNPMHDQVTRTISTNSKGDSEISNTYYPQDYSYSGFSNLISNNIVVPIDQRVYINGKLSSGKTTQYNDLGQPITTSLAESELGTLLSLNVSNPYNYGKVKEQFGYSNNRLNQYNIMNNIVTSYYWGYNQTLPVIKAENLDAATLSSFITPSIYSGYSTFDAFLNSNGTSPNNVMWLNFNKSLRALAPGARITTYTYTPLVGMTSQTDPNGNITTYEYDSFGRLKLIRDKDRKILKQYNYHYKGQ